MKPASSRAIAVATFGGLAGLYMAQFSYGGIVSRLGFAAL